MVEATRSHREVGKRPYDPLMSLLILVIITAMLGAAAACGPSSSGLEREDQEVPGPGISFGAGTHRAGVDVAWGLYKTDLERAEKLRARGETCVFIISTVPDFKSAADFKATIRTDVVGKDQPLSYIMTLTEEILALSGRGNELWVQIAGPCTWHKQ